MKKGFTLVELLAVLVILAVVSMLVFPNVVKIIADSKEKLYQSQMRDIESVGKNFAMDHTELLDANHINPTYVTVDALKYSGYLEIDKISNPKTGEEMNGCVKIDYNETNNQYHYNYENTDCSKDSSLQGFIITYENGLQKKEQNILLSAYETVLKNYENLISIIGGTTDGLYEIDDEYIFRGSNPNNYVKLGASADSYRIISLDKKEKTIKLVKITPESSSYSTNNSNSFLESSVSSYLLNFITSGNAKDMQDQIVDGTKWKNGIIDLSESMSYEVLKSVEATSTVSNKVGLIQVSDYIVSSLDSTCLANIASSNCKNSNYMATLFGKNAVWTMDNSSSGKVITIENNIITNHTLNTTSDITYRIYPVFYLKRSASISSGNGTSSSPYIIK